MPSYVITGVSRGLGFEFLKQISQDKTNVVIGLVRNKEVTEEKIKTDLGPLDNVHILTCDITSYKSIQDTVEPVAQITGGSLDYLIANAAFLSLVSAFKSMETLGKDPAGFEQDLLLSYQSNVVGNTHLYNAYMPLILKGGEKKVIHLSSGHADIDLVLKHNIKSSMPYSITKYAMNLVSAKFSVEYSKDGVLFLNLSPGMVDNHNIDPATLTTEESNNMQAMFKGFMEYAPGFTGPITAEASVRDMLKVIYRSTVENDAGAFVSHKGVRGEWLG